MRRQTPTARRTVLAIAALACLGTGWSDGSLAEAAAQQDPVQCWWRTSAGAVRVAQPFTLLLTCSIVESKQQHVIVDQAKLGPEAIPLSPFEVVGGGTLTESRSGDQWFFQRLYQVRIITDAFGEDVLIPSIVVRYELENESPGGGRARGIERRHALPALPVRVVSLVPAAADDIRDGAIDTFEEIDDAAFAASLYRAAGLVFVGVGVVGLVVALATGFRARHPRADGPGRLEDRLILRQVGRELEAIRTERTRDRWTADLVGRALASTRVVGSYVMRRPLSLRAIERHEQVPAGVLVHSDSRGRRTLITSSLTAAALGSRRVDEDAHRSAIQDTIAVFTRAHYGRDEPLDVGRLDAALDAVQSAAADMKRTHAWRTRTRAAAAARLRDIRIPWFR